MKVAVVFLALVAFVQASSYKNVLRAEFESFKLKHQKLYKNKAVELKRLQIFEANMQLIDAHNERYARGEETFEMGINQFSDLTPEEFRNSVLSPINTTEFISNIDYFYTPRANAAIPNSIDWRTHGAVTGVKNQKNCGSCWAFSAIGTLEGQHFIKNRQLIRLSEQNLVDCTYGAPYNNYGCQGGWPVRALNYIKNNGGVDTEASYPYEAKDGSCRFKKNTIGAKVASVVGITQGDESALAAAVANKGPISVSVDASLFQNYKGGVFNVPSCPGIVSHSVVVVGYGNDNAGGAYWLVKNSWGTSWGESGYIRMARNRNNQCLIATYGVYPNAA